MILDLIVFSVYAFMNVFVYRRISILFELSKKGKQFLALGILSVNAVYFISHALYVLFALNTNILQTAGMLWVRGSLGIFTALVIDAGLALIWPENKRLGFRRILMTVLSLLHILVLFLWIRNIDPVRIYLQTSPGGIVRTAIYGAVVLGLYKIISISLELPVKRKGVLALLFGFSAYCIFTGFDAAFINVIFGAYGAVYARLCAGFGFKKNTRRVILALMIVGFILTIPHMTWWGNGFGLRTLYYFSGIFYGMMILAVTLLGLESLIALPLRNRLQPRITPQITVSITVVLLLALGGYSLYNGSRMPVVKEISIPLKGMKPDSKPLTIVQLSDLHLGDIQGPAWLEKTITIVNHLSPDIIVFTGDLIDKGFRQDAATYTSSLKKLSASQGIFAVTGNHEYYNNRLPVFLELCKKAGIRVLRNQFVTLPGGIQLAGLNDPTGLEFNDEYPYFKKAFKDLDITRPTILLSHRPGFFRGALAWGIDVQLSGHTHAGQIPPMDLLSYIWYTYFYGVYREGDAYIHTSCGSGMVIVPMRLFSKNEITLITLRPDVP